MRLSGVLLTAWCRRLFVAAGVPDSTAATAAEVFWRASRRGLGHHDISYLPQRLGWLSKSFVRPDFDPAPVFQAPAAEVWDAGGSLGEVSCRFALDRAMVLAKTQGLGYAAVRHSNHFLAAAPYVEIGAEKGFFTLVWSNTDAGMALPGGSARKIGNNPLGFAFPTGEARFLGSDLSLAYTSLGQLAGLRRMEAKVPAHWGHGPDGLPAKDADALWKGGVEPIGGPKGFALALLGEILTGLLADGATLDQIPHPNGLGAHNQMVMAWDLAYFGGLKDAQERGESLRKRAVELGPDARIPGERSESAARAADREGISISSETEEELRSWSNRLGVELP